MPNKALDLLYAEGIETLPAGLRGLNARFLSTSQQSIAGLAQSPSYAARGLGQSRNGYGSRARPSFIGSRRDKAVRVVLAGRQGAWGTGRSSRRRPSKAERARNQQRFVQMIKRTHPRLYAIAKARIGEPPAGMGGLGQEKTVATADSGTWFSRLTDTLSTLAPSYLQYKSQKELLEIQLERAQQGLPPLETTQYAPAVQIGLDPAQTRAAISEAGAAAGDFLRQPMVLAAGAGLVLLVMMRRR